MKTKKQPKRADWTLLVWNSRRILVDVVSIASNFELEDARIKLQKRLGVKAEDDDPRWQAWKGRASVETRGAWTFAHRA